MISASKEFKQKLKNGGRVVNYADITLSDGTVLHLTYKDFMNQNGCTIEDKTTDGKFGVGFCIGKTAKIRIENKDEQFSDYDFYNSIINLYVAMQLGDGRIEKIRKGVYYSMVPSTPGDVIEISAVDGMWKLDKDYSAVNTTYPASLQNIITDICSVCGIPIGFRHFDNMSFIVNERPYNLTCRRVLSCAAQIAGCNARIDNDGYMQLVWYNSDIALNYISGGNFKQYPHDTVIDGGDFENYHADTIIDGGLFTDEQPEHIYSVKSLNVCTDDVQITGVRIEKKAASTDEEDTTILFGEEGYVIEVKENPLILGKENEVANFLGGKIVGMVFRPFSAEIPGNPLYEPFDTVKVSDRKGNAYLSFLNSVTYTTGGYIQVACEAEDPLRNGSVYFSDAAAAIVEARRNATHQITKYDHAVQNMNQLVLNSMGIYAEKELQSDGSAIYYESSKPIMVDEDGKCHFEPGSTVWMKSDNGFFISNDGGKPGTFESGWDKNGNVVVNILYAIGIVADWIRTGRFEVKKGDKLTFLADVDTGEVRIVADEFSLSSGKTISDVADDVAKEYYASLKLDMNGIEANVSQLETTVEGNYTALDSEIKQTATSITSTVSSLTGTVDDNYTELNSKITQNANAITAKVSTSDFSSLFEQKAAGITLSVSNDTDSSTISLSGAGITAQSKTIKFTGDIVFESNLTNGTTKVSGSNIHGGTLTLGGANNGNGIIRMLNSNNVQIGSWTNSGITATGADIEGKFRSQRGDEWVEINESIISGGYGSSTDGLLDLSAMAGGSGDVVLESQTKSLNLRSKQDLNLDSTKNFNLNSGRDLQLYIPSGYEIKFIVGGAQKGHFDSSGFSLNNPTQKSGLRYLGISGTTGTVYAIANSTKRHKDILKNMTGEDSDCIYNISPVWAKYKDGYLDREDERNGIYYPMLIAEDVDEHVPFAANHDSDGLADDWNYRVLIPYMIQALKEQKKEIDSLKAKVLGG